VVDAGQQIQIELRNASAASSGFEHMRSFLIRAYE
jgi:hypothetical protein